MARGKRAATLSDEPIAGPWELPEGWRWGRLGAQGRWFGGGTPSKANEAFWVGDIPWVSAKDMKRFHIDDTVDHISHEALASSAAKLVPAGSVLCVMRSGILKHSFPVAVSRRDLTVNQDLRALHPDAHLDPDFLARFLNRSAHDILLVCSKDGTTVDSIEASRLEEWPVPIPPSATQRAIVARIDALFAEIDEGEQALAEARAGVETYRKALLKAAVTGALTADWRAQNPARETGEDLLRRLLADRRDRWKVDPNNKGKRYVEPAGPATQDAPALPEGWCWASPRQLTESIRNGTSKKPDGGPEGHAILRISSVRSMSVSESEVRFLTNVADLGDARASSGDLLVTRYNGSPELVGVCGRYRGTSDIFYPDKLIRLRPAENASPLFEWLEMAINVGFSRRFIQKNTKTTAGQHGVSGETLGITPIPLPPTTEMAEIVREVSTALASTRIGNEVLNGATEPSVLRQSILAAAFRGDLVA